jgi:hypothetical protein
VDWNHERSTEFTEVLKTSCSQVKASGS